MGELKNNLFDFATSELSQDAYICWCANWFNSNDSSKSQLKDMATNMLKIFAGINDVASVDIRRQYSAKVLLDEKDENGKDKYINVKIDVLLIVKDNSGITYGVIVEDKTNTNEHDDQITRYRKGIEKLINDEDNRLPSIDVIRVVYYKSGYIFDADNSTAADVKVYRNCKDKNDADNCNIEYVNMLDLFTPYVKYSEIVADYVDMIKRRNATEERLKKYYDVQGDFNTWDIVNSDYTQYAFLSDLFKDERLSHVDDRLNLDRYYIISKSPHGRPWSHLTTLWDNYDNKGIKDVNKPYYTLFWRVDKSKEGPYLSFRAYSTCNTDELKELVDKYRDIAKEIVDELHDDMFSWEKLQQSCKRNAEYELYIIHINLKDIFENFEQYKDRLFSFVKNFNKTFEERIAELK